MKDATLCFLLREGGPRTILLGYKKRGFGAGKWSGIGGYVEEGEAVAAAAIRKTYEEVGVIIRDADLHARGAITFYFPHRPSWTQTVHIFVATTWQGAPLESEEIRPAWFAPNTLPYDQMSDDARYWLALVLAGETVDLLLIFGEDNATVDRVESRQGL